MISETMLFKIDMALMLILICAAAIIPVKYGRSMSRERLTYVMDSLLSLAAIVTVSYFGLLYYFYS